MRELFARRAAHVAALLALLAGTGPATMARAGGAAAAPSGAIVVEGARTVTVDEVRAFIGFATGQVPDARMLDAAVTTLMATGIFADVRVETRGAALHVVVRENPIIAAVTFEGAAAIERKTLEEAVRLKPRARYTKARANADVVTLRQLYRQQGRLETTIEVRAAERPDGSIDVAFAIREGTVNKIDRIAFAGNRGFDDRTLRDVITTSESGWFDILKTAAFYDPERIEADRELLRRHYLNNGFPDARVTDVAAVLNGDRTAYTVTFTIDEGERRTFGAAAIEGRPNGVEAAALLAASQAKAGNPYSRASIEASVEAMAGVLDEAGHPFARVEPLTRTGATGELDLIFRIAPGKPLHAETIEITGNQRTKDHVIRRELRLADGDPVNPVRIERARKRLRQLGFFKTVEIRTRPGSAPDRVVLTVEVVEQPTGELAFGGGYSTSEGIIGDISWTERNLLGNGQYLRLKLAGSFSRLQADIGFTEPRFLGSNVAAGFDIFYKDVDFTRQSSFKSRKAGGGLRLGLPISDQTTLGLNYTFVRSTLYDVGPGASAAIREAIPGHPGNTSTTYDTSSIGSSVTYDTRDSRRRPTSGLTYTITQDLAGLGGDVRFVKSTGDLKVYYPVHDSVTFKGRVTGGIIEGWGGQDVRLLDLFYKGSDMVRGFATAGIGPRDVLSPNKDALGGRMYLSTTAEAMFDIPGVPRDLGIRGAAFVDAGSLFGTNRSAAALLGTVGAQPSLRASAGVGLIWDSPLGGLRADYALPLVAQPYDKLQPFSFGMMGF